MLAPEQRGLYEFCQRCIPQRHVAKAGLTGPIVTSTSSDCIECTVLSGLHVARWSVKYLRMLCRCCEQVVKLNPPFRRYFPRASKPIWYVSFSSELACPELAHCPSA